MTGAKLDKADGLVLFICSFWLDVEWWIGQGLYEVHPCTGTSDTVCDACLNQPHFGSHPELANEPHPTQQLADYQRQCGGGGGGHHNAAASSQQRNLLSTIADSNSKKRTTSSTGDLIHFLGPTNDDQDLGHLDGTNSLLAPVSTTDNLLPTVSFPSGLFSSTISLPIWISRVVVGYDLMLRVQ